jgi:hypothetical protein
MDNISTNAMNVIDFRSRDKVMAIVSIPLSKMTNILSTNRYSLNVVGYVRFVIPETTNNPEAPLHLRSL